MLVSPLLFLPLPVKWAPRLAEDGDNGEGTMDSLLQCMSLCLWFFPPPFHQGGVSLLFCRRLWPHGAPRPPSLGVMKQTLPLTLCHVTTKRNISWKLPSQGSLTRGSHHKNPIKNLAPVHSWAGSQWFPCLGLHRSCQWLRNSYIFTLIKRNMMFTFPRKAILVCRPCNILGMLLNWLLGLSVRSQTQVCLLTQGKK